MPAQLGSAASISPSQSSSRLLKQLVSTACALRHTVTTADVKLELSSLDGGGGGEEEGGGSALAKTQTVVAAVVV